MTRTLGDTVGAVLTLACWMFATGIEQASAAPFSINIGVITSANGSANFTLQGDTTSSMASLSYFESDQAPDFLNFISTNFSDAAAKFSPPQFSSAPDGIGTTNRLTFDVFNPSYKFTILNTDGTQRVVTGYDLKFDLLQRVAPDGTVYQYDAFLPGSTLLGSRFESDNSFTTVTGTPFALVPLPTSAPMFGAALLAFGTAGVALRHMRAAKARSQRTLSDACPSERFELSLM